MTPNVKWTVGGVACSWPKRFLNRFERIPDTVPTPLVQGPSQWHLQGCWLDCDGLPKFSRMKAQARPPAHADTAANAAPSKATRSNDSGPTPGQPAPPAGPPRLLDRVRHEIRLRHCSTRTESSYVDWIRRYVVFHGRRHPRDMGPAEAAAFLTHLAVERSVAPATRAQGRSAILFPYRAVLNTSLPRLDEVVAASRPRRLLVVLQARTGPADPRHHPPPCPTN